MKPTAIHKPRRLQKGDTVGIIAPCLAASEDFVRRAVAGLQAEGFRVRLAPHLFSAADGYAGSREERADDFNGMIADDEIRMLLFAGGEVCNEILPYIDLAAVAAHPKILSSYSDSTTLLNAMTAQTGLVTFYGCSLRTFVDLSPFNRDAFVRRIMTDRTDYEKGSDWRILHTGAGAGVLTGGYLVNYAALQGHPCFSLPSEPYLLFLEDHKMFSPPEVVSKWFSHLEQHGVFDRATGLLFGHYSENDSPLIDRILCRIGERYSIPVVRCEDFGHGSLHTVLPIGVHASLDATGACDFCFSECATIE